MAGSQKIDIKDAEMTAEVGLGAEGKGFKLAVTLVGSLPGLPAEQAQQLMEAAHEVCPYSNATRGNIDVTLKVA